MYIIFKINFIPYREHSHYWKSNHLMPCKDKMYVYCLNYTDMSTLRAKMQSLLISAVYTVKYAYRKCME
jgi:hypothetical protein